MGKNISRSSMPGTVKGIEGPGMETKVVKKNISLGDFLQMFHWVQMLSLGLF